MLLKKIKLFTKLKASDRKLRTRNYFMYKFITMDGIRSMLKLN